jgi:hypothetical protein
VLECLTGDFRELLKQFEGGVCPLCGVLIALFHLSSGAPAKKQRKAMQPCAVLHSFAWWLSHTLIGNSL